MGMALPKETATDWRNEVQKSKCGRYWFDEAAAERALSFFPKFFRLTTGEFIGRPFVLANWQRDVVRRLFGWKRFDGATPAECTRRYRRCVVWIPRKNGKTEFAAAIGLLALMFDGEMRGEGYTIASTEDQAKLVFQKMRDMIDLNPALGRIFVHTEKSVWCGPVKTAVQPLSGNPKGKHGLNCSVLIGDEVHEWSDDRVYVFVHQSTAGRRQPIEFLISTAGVRGSYGEELYDYCNGVIDGSIDDPEILIVIFEAEPEDDWTDPEVWKRANPNLGISPKLDYLIAECRAAQDSPRRKNDFLNYHLGIWTDVAVRWLDLQKWDECTAANKNDPLLWQRLEDDLKGRPCFAGLDLASTDDICSLVLLFPPLEPGEKYKVLCRFWCPEATVSLRSRRDRLKYDKWVDSGAMIATPGERMDNRTVKDQLWADAEKFDLQLAGIDRWNGTQLVLEMEEEGFPLKPYGQGYGSMNEPSKQLERFILGRELEHGGNPVLRWMVGNCSVEKNSAEDIKPSKKHSKDKIDGVVGLVMSIGLFINPEVEDDDTDDLNNALENPILIGGR